MSSIHLQDETTQRSSSNLPPSAFIMESPVRSQSNFSFKSEENTLEKEILANQALVMQQQEDEEFSQKNNEVEEVCVQKSTTKKAAFDPVPDNDNDVQSTTSSKEGSYTLERTQLMAIQSSSSPTSGIKVSGTLKLMKPFEVHTKYKDLDNENLEAGCFPKFVIAIWSTLFD